jgi:hypothetical protein
MFKRAWLAGLAGIFAISAGVTAAKAESYSLTIIEGACGGVEANCVPNNPAFPNVGFVGFTGTWTSTLPGGGLNFSLPSGGTDTIGGFLASGTGTFTGVTAFNNAMFSDVLSEGLFAKATLFIFTGTVAAANSGTITHDDGILLTVGGVPITPIGDQDPTEAQNTLYAITAAMIGQEAKLFYVAANNLPEILTSPNILGTPLPGTVWLFGAGLGGIAMLMRRRRRGMATA